MSDQDDDEFIKQMTGLRRFGHYRTPVLIAVVSILFAPFLHGLMETYRGIVLESRGGEILVGLVAKVPRWVESVPIPDGTIIVKSMGVLGVKKATGPSEQDLELTNFYGRYIETYSAKIIRLLKREHSQGVDKMVIRLDNGEERTLEIWTEDLAEAKIGMRLSKETRTWQPQFDDASDDASDSPISFKPSVEQETPSQGTDSK